MIDTLETLRNLDYSLPENRMRLNRAVDKAAKGIYFKIVDTTARTPTWETNLKGEPIHCIALTEQEAWRKFGWQPIQYTEDLNTVDALLDDTPGSGWEIEISQYQNRPFYAVRENIYSDTRSKYAHGGGGSRVSVGHADKCIVRCLAFIDWKMQQKAAINEQ